MKQAGRNHSVFPRSSVKFLSRRALFSRPWRKSTFKKVILKFKDSCKLSRNCIYSNSQVSKYQSVGIALQDFYRTIEAHD